MASARVVLHIGMPNAGSSAVQYGLWRHRDELRSRGMHYYTGGKTPRLISSGNGKDLAAYLIPRRREPGFSEAAFEKTFAERFLSGDAVSVISAEQLAGVQADRLEDFRRGLANGHEIQIVAFIRDLYGHARSCWMQQIKRHAYVHDFRRFMTDSYKDSQCGAALKFGRVFGFERVTVIHLNSLRTDLFQAFLGAIDVRARFDPLPRVNRGLSPAEVGMLQLCNRLHRSGELSTLISDHLLRVRPDARRAPVWSSEIAADLQGRFQDRIGRVNARFFSGEPVLQVGGFASRRMAPEGHEKLGTRRGERQSPANAD